MPRRIIGFTQIIECFASKSKLFFWLASQYYRNVIQKEAVLANITSDDHILCIGGGVCPFSAILFHQMTGAKVTVIDNCNECVMEAQKVINRLGLGEYVHAIWQDGGSIEFSLSDFSVVHFAMQVCRMEYVFPHVRKQAVFGTRLLVRRPKKCFNMLYSQLTGAELNCCKHIVHQKACNIGRTLLYIKQECLHEEKKSASSNIRPVGIRSADISAAYPYPVAV